MASRGAHVAGTDGSDHAFRQRVADRYRATRRRADGRRRCSARTPRCASRTRRAPRSARSRRAGCASRRRSTRGRRRRSRRASWRALLAAHGARAVDDKRGTGGARTCALALGGARRGARRGRDVRARGSGYDETGSPAWMWAELTSMAIGETRAGRDVGVAGDVLSRVRQRGDARGDVHDRDAAGGVRDVRRDRQSSRAEESVSALYNG